MSEPGGNGRGNALGIDSKTVIILLMTVIIAVISGWEVLRLRIDALRDKRIDDMSQAIWQMERDRRTIVIEIERRQAAQSQQIRILEKQMETMIGLEVKRIPSRPSIPGIVEKP